MELKLNDMIPPNFDSLLFDVLDHRHTFYTLAGGRGSTKSSFVSVAIILLITQNPLANAVVLRKHSNTLRDSVYAQLRWAIEILGMDSHFLCNVSPMQIIYKPTGQQILFRGVDDPTKLKSLKFKRGYCAILWEEESSEFAPGEIRSVQQTIMRGGESFWVFDSFNPPINKNNWKNKDILVEKPNWLIHKSDYRTVPVEWLSQAFFDQAEYLQQTNERLYNNEYLGEATGTGDAVFENVKLQTITDEEIKSFDWIYMGLDFGWYPDILAWAKMYYHASQKRLCIFDEFTCNKTSNADVWEHLTTVKSVSNDDLIIADSAEPKSIADFKSYGAYIRGAEKGAGSVDYSMKWLASLNEIIIDPVRCPVSAREFGEYEYLKDKFGEIIGGYEDKNNHCIDAVRYGLNQVWKKRGM